MDIMKSSSGISTFIRWGVMSSEVFIDIQLVEG